MEATENTGARPSLLDLARRATGESEGALPPAYRAALQHSEASRPPLDLEAIRERARALPSPDPLLDRQLVSPPALPAPANRPRLPWLSMLAPGLALAAAAVFFVTPEAPTGPAYTGIKGGGVQLSWAVEDHGAIRHGTEDLSIDPGQRLQLQVYPGEANQLAVVSIDSTGTLTWIAPEAEAEGTVALEPGRTWLVPGALRLDDAPGPEVFVAGVGLKAEDLAKRVADAQALGLEHLEALSDDPALDVLVVSKAAAPAVPGRASE